MAGSWNRLRKVLFEKLAEALVNPFTPYISAAVSLILPTVALWAGKGLAFLTASHPVPGWLVAPQISIALFLLLILVRQEVRVGQLKAAARQAPQGRFAVNCFHCGSLIEVVNPRPGRQPTQVRGTGMPTTGPDAQFVGTACPTCRGRQTVQFEY